MNNAPLIGKAELIFSGLRLNMRRILVDHARGDLREKRGGGQREVPLDEALVFAPEQSEELVKLDAALERLTKLDPRQGRNVELLFLWRINRGTNG
jgi:hypothetical protein